ncbi:unnamed protein product [Cylindrotheca closterium]|uniref:DDE-1 domain-containing protein n=1 Tax=Cylindrotheca closterium TaxID=2856 RepID=A0AAD2JH25_9STRA|nr:unnamed protein product [Cylindrotheca closterium]
MASERSSSSHSASSNVRELDSNDPMSPKHKHISPKPVGDGSVKVDAVKIPALPSVDDSEEESNNDDENVEKTKENADTEEEEGEGIEVSAHLESPLAPPILRPSKVRPSASKASERVSFSGGDSKPGAVSVSSISGANEAEEPLGQTVDKEGESTHSPRRAARPSASKANERISSVASDEASRPGATSVVSPVGQRRSKAGAAAASLRRNVTDGDNNRDSINEDSVAGSVYSTRSDPSEAKLRSSALRMAPALGSAEMSLPSSSPSKEAAMSPMSATEDAAEKDDAYADDGKPTERGVDDSDGATMLTAEVAPDIDEIVNNAVQKAVQQTLEAQNQTSPRGVSVAQEVIDPERQQPVEATATVYNGKQGDDDDEEGKILGLSKKIFWIIVVVILLIISIAVGVGVSASGGGDDTDNGSREIPINDNVGEPTATNTPVGSDPTNVPSESPSTAPSSIPSLSPLSIYAEVLLPGVEVSTMDRSSAEYKGLRFIASEDTLGLEPTKDPRLLERFALTVLYYSTNGAGWTDSFRWVTGADHCNWYQVNCDSEDRVTKLDGTLNNVTGSIPTQIGDLIRLEALWLGNNGLGGVLVSEIGQLTALTQLSLWSNKFRSSIPTEIGNLSALQILSFATNELVGPIPSEIGRLTNLGTVQLNTNSIDGPIPSEIGFLTLLRDWSVNRNIISGTLPGDGFAKLTGLQNLQLWQNGISGTLPSEFALMTSLTSLGISTNALVGPIPSELGNLSNMDTISLFGNSFSSAIPTTFGNLIKLRYLVLETNTLSGPVPSELGKLTGLLELKMFGNSLTGTIPTEIGNLRRLTYFGVSDNMLNGTIPSEFQGLDSLTEAYFYGNEFTSGLETLFCGAGLEAFYADCNGSPADLDCACCTHCCENSVNDCQIKPPTVLPPSLPPALAPTMSPTRSRISIMAEILLPDTSLTSPTLGTDEYKALRWLAMDDPRLLPAEDTVQLRERFALMLLYFSTNGDSSWSSNTNWKTATDHCLWRFVQCTLGSVEYLDMTENGLRGTLPSQISYLTNLQTLFFAQNTMRGTLPSEIGLLTSLRSFQVWTNEFFGSIPSEIGLLTGVTNLAIFGNFFEGTIPDALRNLSNLNFLSLQENVFDSTVPTWLGEMTQLDGLGLGGNLFSGTIPTELSQLTLLSTLQLWENQLQGSIPSELSQLTSLTSLGLSSNSLNGTIAPEFGNLVNATELQFWQNELTGSVPSSLSALTGLTSLGLSSNSLTGALPSELGSLTTLSDLSVFNNQFTGTISSEFSRLTNLESFGFFNNDFSGTIPSELGRLSNVIFFAISGNPGITGTVPSTLQNLSFNHRVSMNPPQDPTAAGPLPDVVADADDIQKSTQSYFQDGGVPPARSQPSYINNVARVRAPSRKQDGAALAKEAGLPEFLWDTQSSKRKRQGSTGPNKQRRQRYTKEHKQMVVDYFISRPGSKIGDTAKQFNIPEGTVRGWFDDDRKRKETSAILGGADMDTLHGVNMDEIQQSIMMDPTPAHIGDGNPANDLESPVAAPAPPPPHPPAAMDNSVAAAAPVGTVQVDPMTGATLQPPPAQLMATTTATAGVNEAQAPASLPTNANASVEKERPQKRRRQRYSNETKIQVILALESRKGRSLNDIAREYNVASGTVRGWRDEADKIQKAAMESRRVGAKANPSRDPLKRIWSAILGLFEKNSLLPESQQLEVNVAVVRTIGTQARDTLLLAHSRQPFLTPTEIAAMEKFKGSETWARKWAKDHQVFTKRKEKVPQYDMAFARLEELQKVVGAYDAECVYTVTTMSLFFRIFPHRAYVTRLAETGKRVRACKGLKSKDRVTLYVCSNEDGTDKAPIACIGKYDNPACFRVEQQKVMPYFSQKNALSDASTFQQWWRSVFLPHIRKLHPDGNKCLLLVELEGDSRAEFLKDPMGQVRVETLPVAPEILANGTPIKKKKKSFYENNQGGKEPFFPQCQALEHEILDTIKRRYRYRLLQEVMETYTERYDRQKVADTAQFPVNARGLREGSIPNLCDSMRLLSMIWGEVAQTTIVRAWQRTKLRPRPQGEVEDPLGGLSIAGTADGQKKQQQRIKSEKRQNTREKKKLVKDLTTFMTENPNRAEPGVQYSALEDSVNKLKNCCLYIDGGVVEEKELMDTVEDWIGLETSAEVKALQMDEVKEEMNIDFLCNIREPIEGAIPEADEGEDPELDEWLVQKNATADKPAEDGSVKQLDIHTALSLASSIKATATKVFEEGNALGGLAVQLNNAADFVFELLRQQKDAALAREQLEKTKVQAKKNAAARKARKAEEGSTATEAAVEAPAANVPLPAPVLAPLPQAPVPVEMAQMTYTTTGEPPVPGDNPYLVTGV